MDEIGGDPGASFRSGGLFGLLDQGDRLIAKAEAKFPLLARLFAHTGLSARSLLLAFFGAFLLALLLFLTPRLLRRWQILEFNFRRDLIPQSFGLLIAVWSAAMLLLTALLFPALRRDCLLWLLTVVGFGSIGFLDDRWGDKRIKGLRAHFRAALRDHKITTGFIKAVGGALLALGLGFLRTPDSIPRALLAAAVIALASNAVNLLDLRPGRAGAVFLLTCALLWLLRAQTETAGLGLLLYIVIPTLPVYERDARARAMLGDTGSNLLGACLGLFIAESLPIFAQVAVLLFLIALHILAERISLTAFIERTPALRALDRLTGLR